MLRLNPGYADDSPPTPWQKVACTVVVGVGLPAVMLHYSSDIGASFLLLAIVYAFQSHSGIYGRGDLHGRQNIRGEISSASLENNRD